MNRPPGTAGRAGSLINPLLIAMRVGSLAACGSGMGTRTSRIPSLYAAEMSDSVAVSGRGSVRVNRPYRSS